MIKLNLQRTCSKISEYLNNNPNPLRLVELINRIPPCCWTFRFTFDGTGRTTVEIYCDHNISDNDALALLDGSLEEVFFADAIFLRQGKKYITTDTSNLLKNPPSSNQIVLRNNSHTEANSLLTLEGFSQSCTTPLEIQQNSVVCSYFFEHTWLGSPDLANSKYCIRWIVFGAEQLIQPQNRYITKLGSTDIFTTQSNLYNANSEYIGQANLHTSPLLENDAMYTMFGPLLPKQDNRLVKTLKSPHWIIEIDNQKLNQNITTGKSNTKLINELIDSVETARNSVINTDCFQLYKQKMEWKQQTKAADNLKERQERAQKGSKVIFNSNPVMLVPSNENEVIVLLSKLETLNALPFHEFTLWEYTSSIGIDAIASYQIRKVDARFMFAPIELEYYFENFFAHGHPHHQVNLVICWDFRDCKTASELHKHNEWLFEYRKAKSFTVLVLSYIPNLQVERSEK